MKQMAQLDDNSIDSIVTDPPYGLSFMGKKWDYDVPSVDIWIECLRVLKPGGHLLAFAGTRTQHRMAVNIEDAGFEIRDMIAWVYGSGFPKSLNIGKAVDKLQGNDREVVGISNNGAGNIVIENLTGSATDEQRVTVSPVRQREGKESFKEFEITKGNSPYEGWGTALKPALEPITVARKPIKGTVADNVLKWGTGGLNIDECRVGVRTENESGWSKSGSKASENRSMSGANYDRDAKDEAGTGRWPANLIHDGSEEVERLFPSEEDVSQSRFFYCAKASKSDRDEGLEVFEAKFAPTMGKGIGGKEHNPETATPKRNHHPTVKPTDLMRYLVKLVTPPNGIVLDPFMGSGSTGKACVSAGFSFIGIEMEQEYIDIAKARIEREKKKGIQSDLF